LLSHFWLLSLNNINCLSVLLMNLGVAVPEVNRTALSLVVFVLGMLALTIGSGRRGQLGGAPAGSATG
jgi:hypothetical protein